MNRWAPPRCPAISTSSCGRFQDPSEMDASCHGTVRVRNGLRTTVENSQVRMISCACGAGPSGRSDRTGPDPHPAAGDLRRERRRSPRIHHVRVGDKATGPSRWPRRKPGGTCGLRVDRQRGLSGRSGRRSRARPPRRAGTRRERHAEEPLTRPSQSPFSPPTQFRSGTSCTRGASSIVGPRSSRAARRSA